MNRTRLNAWIDLLAFLGFVLLVVTGFVQRFVLPPGTGGHGKKGGTLLWGLDRHQWGEMHFWIAVGLMAVLAVHLVLHWKWIAAAVRGKAEQGAGLRVWLGILGLLALLGLAAVPFLSPTEKRNAVSEADHPSPKLGDQQNRTEHHSDEKGRPSIKGSMTLREVESETGIPMAHIIDRLGLPEDTDPDQRLGQLKKSHEFTIEQVRDIVEEFVSK